MKNAPSSKFVFSFLLSWALFGNVATTAASVKIKVPVTFVEALAPKDTTSSERFQKEYESAVAIGKTHSKNQLAKCGYEISEKLVFYDASDSIQALEQAKKSAGEGSWLLVGPRRSNHYLLFVKGAPDTPSVSLMASAKEVSTLGSLHLSMAPLNGEMAGVAVEKVKSLMGKNKASYLSVVSEDCVTCVDFAAEFDKSATKGGVKKLAEIKVVGESPDLEPVKKLIKQHSPKFVLLPNYSKVSAAVIHAVLPIAPETVFVGGDGWGDTKFGFVQNNENLDAAKGFTVRGFPPVAIGLTQFDLGKNILKDKIAPDLASGSALAIVRIFDGLAKFLCEAKPSDSKSFQASFKSKGKKQFSAPWGVSIYSLKSGNIVYSETRR
ncbi:MAG: hypothetical protein EXR74_09595 [Bdellovibrionales bacterium]|nr:hypothetical protein [Bdellovibrionales bacterium]